MSPCRLFRIPYYLFYAALMISMLHASSVLAQREECLHTQDGVPMKVIIKQDAAVYEQPSESSGSRPVRTFDWFYVLPVEKGSQEKLKNGFYRVAQGTSFDHHVGWVKEEVVIEWNHRQAISFRGNPARNRVIFYNSFEDLQKYMLETKNPRNPQPISQEPENLGSDFLVMPVLDVRILNVSGTETDVYRAAYLHGNGSGKSSQGLFPNSEQAGSKSLPEFQKEYTLDVVFVIDTTASMQPWIDGVKEVVRKVSESFRDDPEIKGRVRFGLVAYRDMMRTSEANRQIEYLTKIFCKLSDGKDSEVFFRNVSELEDADKGSEDWPEDVFAGMKVAIQQMDWNPIADRHLILIGDASGQDNMEKPNEPGSSQSAYKNFYKLTPGVILSMAQVPGRTIESEQSSITIHALRIKGEYTADWPKCESHFKKLASGPDRPGLYKAYDLSSMNRFADDLLGHDYIKAGIERLAFIQSATKADDLFRSAAAKGGLLNVPSLKNLIGTTLIGPGEPARSQVTDFTSGWACKVDIHDNFQLEPHVLVTRGRMGTFVTVLDNILQVLDKTREPGSGDIAKALQSLQIVATHVMYEEQIDKETELGDILSWILALPIKSKIFSMSIPALRAMTQEHFDDWVNSVRATRQIIQASLDDRQRWRSIGSSTSEIEKRAFIKVADMP